MTQDAGGSGGVQGREALTPICAIGASAGGVKALQTFFEKVNPALGLAYVVIVHLAPEHESQLSDILSKRTTMPVRQVEDTPRLEPDCVYVIAPDRELVITSPSGARQRHGCATARRRTAGSSRTWRRATFWPRSCGATPARSSTCGMSRPIRLRGGR